RRAVEEPPAFSVCFEGSGAFTTLTPVETDAIVKAAASALNTNTATISGVDRPAHILALFRQPAAGAANDDQAVGVARTAAFFSHNMAPLSSRTVRFITGIHFPPGVSNAPNAALYGIENTNRGCEIDPSGDAVFNPGQSIPAPRSIAGTFSSAAGQLPAACNPSTSAGCSVGITTG